jgi:hypothetical protein
MAPLAGLTETTTFADALAREEGLFDRLAAQNAAFRKFARVLMREDVAPRLALRDVANMAGVPTAYVIEIATGATPALVQPGKEPAYHDSRGQAPTTFDAEARTIDVRSELDNGHEPLGRILDALDVLGPAEDLVVEATFHPVPLRRLLGGRGFASFAEMLSDQHWRVRFRREPRIRDAESQSSSCCGGCSGSHRA